MLDWQTDEDPDSDVWEKPVPRSHPISLKSFFHRFWRTLVVVGLLLGVTVGVTVWRVQAQVQETAAQMRADVQQMHQTVWQTAVSADTDLFPLFLSPHNTRWQLLQRYRLSKNLIVHHAPFNLWLDKTAVFNPTTPRTQTVYLSPDFQLAEIQFFQPYVTRLPDGSLQTVMLQKTAVYAQTGSGWLQTDPALKTSFWGPYKVNTAGSNVTLIYPNRDKVLGRRLLADFDEMVQQLCRDPDLHCPPDFKLRVVLNTEVESYLPLLQSDLLQLSGRIFNADLNQAIYEVALPTPTLVGIPQDDAGYAALWRGYAAWTAVHLLNDMVETPLSYTAVKAKLTQLGLHLPAPASFNPQPQPLTANPPAQSVQVLCRDRGQAAEIWTYDLQTNTWAQLTDETARTHFYDQLAAKETVSIIAPLRRDAQPSEQALLTAVSPAYTPTSLSVTQVWQHESMRTFLAQDQADEKMHYLFQENLTNGRLQFLHRFSLSFSLLRLSTLGENGRFLTLVSYNNRLNQTRFIIYDLVQQADRTIVADGLPFNRFGWSANGEWLFVLKQRTLVLTAPATRDQTVIEHPQYGCQTALWLP